MKKQRMTIDPSLGFLSNLGRIDIDRVDATTEEEIARQKAADEAEAMLDAAKYARRVRRRLGLTQAEFSLNIGVLYPLTLFAIGGVQYKKVTQINMGISSSGCPERERDTSLGQRPRKRLYIHQEP